jgi:hypothetical protein
VVGDKFPQSLLHGLSAGLAQGRLYHVVIYVRPWWVRISEFFLYHADSYTILSSV